MKCEHCGKPIKKEYLHDAWHRKGHHYCCYSCYKDEDGCKPSILTSINRKKRWDNK